VCVSEGGGGGYVCVIMCDCVRVKVCEDVCHGTGDDAHTTTPHLTKEVRLN
jgi:hypothetical protein